MLCAEKMAQQGTAVQTRALQSSQRIYTKLAFHESISQFHQLILISYFQEKENSPNSWGFFVTNFAPFQNTPWLRFAWICNFVSVLFAICTWKLFPSLESVGTWIASQQIKPKMRPLNKFERLRWQWFLVLQNIEKYFPNSGTLWNLYHEIYTTIILV